MKKIVFVSILALAFQFSLDAQRILTLEECRELAVNGNKELEMARQKTIMADYDRKTALANYFPSISATGTYMYNSRDIALVSPEQSASLSGLGTIAQSKLSGTVQALMSAVMSNPSATAEYATSPMWQTVLGTLSQVDASKALNELGSKIDEALHLDITNVYAGVVSIQQPIFVGGKIVASNKIASLAKELAETEYDEKRLTVELEAESSYWQVVSVAAKDRLAETYLDLLEHLEKDAEIALEEGVAVHSDVLAVKVKLNEARMLQTKTSNGLVLSKMLLCKQIGLPLDSDIVLADENGDAVPEASFITKRDMDDVFSSRNETKMLDFASKIYDKKVAVVRADYLPKVAVTGNYLISNPSFYNGFKNEFAGMYNVGVLVSVPIFHATEGLQKVRKAKTEAEIYRLKYENACDMISLQVEQLSRQQDEVSRKFDMAKSNLDCAEENLRTAMIGFSEGVITSDVALQAQTAWVKAETEYIDAGIELQLNHSSLLKAQGEYK